MVQLAAVGERVSGYSTRVALEARNLVRGFALTPDDLGLVPSSKHCGRPREAAP